MFCAICKRGRAQKLKKKKRKKNLKNNVKNKQPKNHHDEFKIRTYEWQNGFIYAFNSNVSCILRGRRMAVNVEPQSVLMIKVLNHFISCVFKQQSKLRKRFRHEIHLFTHRPIGVYIDRGI